MSNDKIAGDTLLQLQSMLGMLFSELKQDQAVDLIEIVGAFLDTASLLGMRDEDNPTIGTIKAKRAIGRTTARGLRGIVAHLTAVTTLAASGVEVDVRDALLVDLKINGIEDSIKLLGEKHINQFLANVEQISEKLPEGMKEEIVEELKKRRKFADTLFEQGPNVSVTKH